MPALAIDLPRDEVAEFCHRHRIRRLSIFGSATRDDFRPDSDIDVLVEFEPGHSPGWDIVLLEEEFSQLAGGHPVRFINPKYLHRLVREPILASAVEQYVAP